MTIRNVSVWICHCLDLGTLYDSRGCDMISTLYTLSGCMQAVANVSWGEEWLLESMTVGKVAAG